MTRNVDQLRSIQTFEQLIPFLEQDLDWPFPDGRDYEFDDLTFEYTPDELGLESDYAAKIKGIHQLRPLVGGQPWGIFFVEFENKKLPIVVLRRILSHLVLKQRKSANPADRARWNAGDLLFISAFAEEGTSQREIAFAHFHQDPGDQPTLRVLGWDGGDTPLKLEHVSQLLRQRLSWPRNPGDHAAWRKQWAGAFRYKIGEQIRTADLLARELARVARNIRDAAMALMKVESAKGPLRRMHEAFRTALIHDLTQEGFADTYAQTITYGLLTAAISRTDRSAGADGTFVLAEDIHNMVPITNPFLKEMLESFLKVGGRGTSKQPGLDFDELGVQEVVEMLRSSDIDLPAVLEDFGNRNPGEDPVIRFYEDFLKAYNKELKIKRGVFYTPQPVVSYIVRSVHELLQTEFGLPDGLASTITWGEMAAQMAAAGKPFTIPKGTSPDSHFVIVLDPATGTATFLVEVIDVIFRTLTEKWKEARITSAQQRDKWNLYVPVHLLPRLFGYELLMAPYAIAHMKIGLKLHETGYVFSSHERVRVYLTNALEPPTKAQQSSFEDWIPALAHEADAVSSVKATKRFTVVLGNPPYSIRSGNLTDEARQLVETFKFVAGTRLIEKGALQLEKNLNDDYVKFFGLLVNLMSAQPVGITCVITNHAFLDNPTLRGLRWKLLDTFSDIRVLDLHGNSKKKEDHPAGTENENVFDIQQGVSISMLIRKAETAQATISHADLWGRRNEKYEALLTQNVIYTSIACHDPWFKFCAQDEEIGAEFRQYISIAEAMPFTSTGIKTHRDAFVIDFDEAPLRRRIEVFRSSASDEQIKTDYGLADTHGWRLKEARKRIRARQDWEASFRLCLYRPFDVRHIYYHPDLVELPRTECMRNLSEGTNLAILTTRQVTSPPFNHMLVTRLVNEMKTCSHDRGTNCFPLYLENNSDGLLARGKIPNISEPVLRLFAEVSGHQAKPEDVLQYIYAVCHSPTYRARYAEFLKTEFPRVPISVKPELFRALTRLGAELVQLHLMEHASSRESSTFYVGTPGEVETITYSDDTVYINRQQSRGFSGVPRDVWEYHVGGYQVCHKWLKDRKGRVLSREDATHFEDVVACISQTIQAMAKIDLVVEEHGGWPGAFV